MSLNDQDKNAGLRVIRFAEFAADLRTEELTRAGRRVRLPRQSFQVLAALTRAPGELVTREQLQAELWPAQTEVEYEQGLNAAINRLRDALGDSAAEPKFIETLPRRGYRFIGNIDAPPAPPAAAVADPGTAAIRETARTTGPRPLYWIVIAAGAVMGIVAIGLLLIRKDEVAAPRLVPFTALAGEERAPTFSPDGTRIAFAWNGSPGAKGFDLFVKARGSEHLLQLTKTGAQALSAAWSPDGTQIAFARRNGDAGVYLVPALGGAERLLVKASFPNDYFMQVAWSPDGRRIAYSSYDGSGRNGIRFVDAQTLAVTTQPDAPECWTAGLPAWSDDGRQFAFACTTSVGVYGIYLVDAGKPRMIATLMGEAQGLAFAQEGRSLILANDAGDGGALWRLSLDGSRTRLPYGEEGVQPARVQGGAQLAYVRARQSVAIWRMDLGAADAGATAQRLIASTRAETTPQYSADGARITFQSTRSGSAEIWMADATGANPVRLTEFDGPMTGAPRWCADGKRVALDSRVGGSSSIYVVDAEQRRPQRIDSAQVSLALPVWSPDCRWLLASDGRTRLYRVSVPDGKAEPFTQQTSYYGQFAGNDVIFNVKVPDGVNLWRKKDGQETALPGLPKISYLDAWAVTARGVYFTSAEPGGVAVSFYDLATAGIRRIASLPKPPVPGGGLGIAVSPDDRWLLYTQNAEAQSDLMLTE